ncbi:MAG TPA: SRPBCC family protein [Burkholderiales bacterium]|nr:SRPBCC family protein [Burkholderiales bacterium]
MKVKLERTFPMPASAEVAWALLQDIAGVAACMPGAKITERVDDTHYKGTVSVKVGPASLSFRGEIEVKSVDASTRTLHLFAKGTDTTGSSAATMDLTARIDALDASSCNLAGDSEVSMSGKAASFGARLMGPVSDQVLGQFAANFAARLKQAPPDSGAAAPAQGAAAPAPEAKPLNALALAWAVIRGWLRSLFTGKRA